MLTTFIVRFWEFSPTASRMRRMTALIADVLFRAHSSVYLLSILQPSRKHKLRFNVTKTFQCHCLFVWITNNLNHSCQSLLQITILLSSSGLLSARLIASVGVPRCCRGHHTPSSVPSLRTTDTRPRRRGASSRGLGRSQLPSTVILHSWKFTMRTEHLMTFFIISVQN